MDKKNLLKEELRLTLTEAGRNYVENVIMPKHTNSLPITNVPDGIKPYEVVDVIPVPEGATNGDVMQLMFPDGKYGTNGDFVHVYIPFGSSIQTMTFDLSWWNAKYKKETKGGTKI